MEKHPTQIRGELSRLIGPVAELAAKAGDKIREVAKGDLGATQKSDKSPVTIADTAAEEILREGLAKLLPGIPFIGEESVAAGNIPEPGNEFLLIDPLDGTREFIKGRDDYTVNVGLIANGEPIFGVIYTPATKTVHAGADGSAIRAPLDPSEKFDFARAEKIQARPRPKKMIAAVSRSYLDEITENFLKGLLIESRLQLGSSLKFTRLAQGDADVYPRLTTISEWDVAAGHALLKAAGGRVEALDGTPLRYGAKQVKFNLPGFVAWGAPPLR
jgi:3'(2'), 5'-bisphosphate nucleotidase